MSLTNGLDKRVIIEAMIRYPIIILISIKI